MNFKSYTVTPKGRNKYGTYISKTNVTSAVRVTTYAGNNSTGGNNTTEGDINSKYLNYPTIQNGYWYVGTANTNVAYSENEKQTVWDYNGYWMINGTNTNIAVLYNPNFVGPTWTITLSKDNNTFSGEALALGNVTDSTNVIGYREGQKSEVYVGELSGSSTSASSDYNITGITSGMSVSVTGQATTACTILITMTSAISTSNGTLYIPCNVSTNPNIDLENDIYEWEDAYHKGNVVKLILEYNWNISTNATSAYKVDLSNENTTINCDSGWTILSGATRPTCTASTYYGSEEITAGCTYSLSYPSTQAVSDLTINTSTGVLTFGSNFSFSGTTLNIDVSSTYLGSIVGTSTMTVTKVRPGDDGSPATSYWMVISAKAIHVTSGGTPSPSVVVVSAMMQVGQNTPETATGCTIQYGYETSTPATTYPSTGITIDTTKTYLALRLLKDSKVVDGIETVPILWDGQQGTSGETGRQGFSLRGPVLWEDAHLETGRRWCNGVLLSDLFPEDGIYKDIIKIDDAYYVCVTSYTETGAAWSAVSSNWLSAETQYDFVASKVLLAENAKINFMTGNDIYLVNSAGTVTAGAAGGNGINFWAGSTASTDAPFTVNNDGTMVAEKGTFGCMEIGTDTQFGDSLISTGNTTEVGDYHTLLSARGIDLDASGGDEYPAYNVGITSTPWLLNDRNAPVTIAIGGVYTTQLVQNTAIETNGRIEASGFKQRYAYQTATTTNELVYPLMTPFESLKIVFLTTTPPTATISSDGYTYINGIKLCLSVGSTDVFELTSSICTNYGYDQKYVGYYVVGRLDYTVAVTGFADPDTITKQADTIYMTL